MNRVKLIFLDCRYSIHEEQGVVIAKSSFKWMNKTFTTTGVARCNPAIFDKRAGKQLARARAERRAYIIVKEDIIKVLKLLNKSVETFNNSLDFFNNCIQHQDEYIETF